MQSFSLRHSHLRLPVDVVKQKAAFPPNFIHSLDATHMLMTATACAEIQDDPITFAAVHDSYWTHACDVERLRVILKQEFIRLHSQPIMENLKREFETRYGDRLVQRVTTVDDVKSLLEDPNVDPTLIEVVDQETLLKETTLGAVPPGKSSTLKLDTPDDVDAKDKSNLTLNTTPIDPLMEGLEEDDLTVVTDEDKSSEIDEPISIRKNQKYIRRWTKIELQPVPPRGDLDIQQVAHSEYFFS